MKRLYKNWFIHNLIGHPLSEIAFWVLLGTDLGKRASQIIHDQTLPEQAFESNKRVNT